MQRAFHHGLLVPSSARLARSSRVRHRELYRCSCFYTEFRYSPGVPPRRFDPDEYLPLTTPMFQVLVALADGEKHGYAIIKEVRRRTDDKVVLTAGTLYGVIKRFVDEGLIVESEERPDPALDDERRRYFRLSANGRAVATAEARRMEEAVRHARAKRLLSPRTT